MAPKSWTIKELLEVTADYLKEKEIESPRLSAEILLAHQLDVQRMDLYLNFDKPLNESEISGYRSLIRRRIKREPAQYITGVQEFWSLEFMVGPQTLIPRPESEVLIEQAIKLLNADPIFKDKAFKLLDLGTGSGALAISMAKEMPQARIWATDISSEALDLAQLNAKKHGVSDRIEFYQGDLWGPMRDRDAAFDIILSNPPYVSDEEYEGLPPEVRDYEPRVALGGYEGGMYYIERIIAEGSDFMNPKGWLLLEMAPHQTEKALDLIGQNKGYGEKYRIKDYSHNYRVVVAQKG